MCVKYAARYLKTQTFQTCSDCIQFDTTGRIMFFSSLEKNSSLEQNGLKYSILFKFISLHYISYTALHVCVCVEWELHRLV